MSNYIRIGFLLALLCGCDKPNGQTQSKKQEASDGAVAPQSLRAVDTIAETDSITPALQELNDLLAQKTRLIHKPDKSRELAIGKRRSEIHAKELGGLNEVANCAGLACNEEPMYGQPSYGIILYATATEAIRANELLLFNSDSVFRTEAADVRPLKTDSEGWYFRPNSDVPSGTRFVVACIQDAPEELENVKNGFMPNSHRARNPNRPYSTRLFYYPNGTPLANVE